MIRATHRRYHQAAWLEGLGDRVVEFLNSLRDPDHHARYLPCLSGVTETGRQISLGHCCFAVKTLFTMGQWQSAGSDFRREHIDWIQQFQSSQSSQQGFERGAFIDAPLRQALLKPTSWRRRLKQRLFARHRLSDLDRLYLAETKQACATLHQVGETPHRIYRGIETDAHSLRKLLARLPWQSPWAAGGQFSCIATLLSLGHGAHQTDGWRRILTGEVDRIADPLSGAYFSGPRPDQGQLINGAMKVLTALDWLKYPIHHPDRLIDSCLRRPPEASGCHLVDVVYVLHRCLEEVDYRRVEAAQYAWQVLQHLEAHHGRDGGFSYHVGQSQTGYYGARIAHGFPESDLHATCLLVWAVALCERLVNEPLLEWNVIKP